MEKIRVARLRSGNFVSGPEKSILTFCSQTKCCDMTIISFCKVHGQKNDFLNKAKEMGINVEAVLMKSPFDFKGIKRLAKILEDKKIQILHTHGFKEDIVGYFAGKRAGVKLIAMTHGWTGHTLKVRFYEILDLLILRFFDKIIIVSEYIKNSLLKFGIPKSKIVAINNAIDFSNYLGDIDRSKARNEFGIKENEILIGTVGRLSKEKGHKYFLQVAVMLNKDFSNLKYMIVGDGPEKERLLALRRKLNLEDKVIFTGRREDINNFFSAFDLFVLPSLREFLPNVILEAFIFKKPVVATRVGGVPELIFNNETGLISRPKDAVSLLNNIKNCLNDFDKAKVMGQKGFELIKNNFSAEDRIKKIEELYMSILSKGK